ncbi:MFS transporter [Candidatus Mycobacterium wuenschmannii]|uniref:MFS transporter n=1 Tax=Candidatus Mycobacterium wuenschmannii TaxID=3027808 RepID=A0ABY8VWP7_9MYCO|nr:MFS transporter [Candidatus Mycobacterium wuenschmannii]WIM88068.1 MFS transporter [Candidatus Mycobacterium wuenschmannii]
MILVSPRARYTAWRRRKARLPSEAWVLIAANAVAALGYGVVSPVLPAFTRSFGASMGAVTFAITIFSVMRLFAAPPTGLLVQRLGEQWIYLTGLLIVSVATGVCAFIHSYWELLLLRAIGGIGSTMFFISALGLMIRISPPDARGRVAGLFATSFLVGAAAGPLVGSLTAGLGLRAPFLMYGVAVLLTTFVVAHTLRRSTLGAPAEHAEPAVTVRVAMRHPAYRAALVSNFATGWAVFGLRMAVVPLFISDVLGRGPRMTGLALGVFALGNLAVAMPSGHLSDRIGRRHLLIGGLMGCSVATLLLGASTMLPVFLVAAFLGGAASGIVASPQQAAIADILGSSARTGTAVSTFQMTVDLGAIVGSMTVTEIAQHLSFQWGFVISAVVLFAAGVVWIFAPETRVVGHEGSDTWEAGGSSELA